MRVFSDSHDGSQKPYAMIGAGSLSSMIWKHGSERDGWEYRFNFFSLLRKGQTTQKFRSRDLRQFVKLLRLLTATIVEDGCLYPEEHEALADLASRLDVLDRVLGKDQS